ncbi:hypothetical protein BpHYR1_006492 [Brachionus plicatilis]|uniref:Uncharacterized protein n=1 Tax=Brachionus plicatilis TaxID=10195 RepID=A0A3M7R1B5_BRAPC|nr:hypothetical protein BpHYR1_006492 [Brachionus plicatilis]
MPYWAMRIFSALKLGYCIQKKNHDMVFENCVNRHVSALDLCAFFATVVHMFEYCSYSVRFIQLILEKLKKIQGILKNVLKHCSTLVALLNVEVAIIAYSPFLNKIEKDNQISFTKHTNFLSGLVVKSNLSCPDAIPCPRVSQYKTDLFLSHRFNI